ncbi:MAG: hypothetical protein ABL308_14080 [Oceanicaulis sp.]
MARLQDQGRTTFVILDDDPIYTEADVTALCARHRIDESRRGALWRTLEEAGRAWQDRRRLQSQPAKLARIRQDLRLGRQLACQLAEIVPETGQVGADRGSVALSRRHLSALREGERKAGAGRSACARLDEVRATIDWLAEVYEAALESCTRAGEDADQRWRAQMTEFWTRTLARSWTGGGEADGERFLADCKAPLERGEAAEGPPVTAVAVAGA